MQLKIFKKLKIKLFAFLILIVLILDIGTAFGLDITLQKEEEKGLIEYLPFDNTISLIANLESREINEFIKNNFSKGDQNNINTLKNGLLSYAGISSQDVISDIYDGEFAISVFTNENAKDDILVIMKVKNQK